MTDYDRKQRKEIAEKLYNDKKGRGKKIKELYTEIDEEVQLRKQLRPDFIESKRRGIRKLLLLKELQKIKNE